MWLIPGRGSRQDGIISKQIQNSGSLKASAFGFIQSQGKKEFLFIGNWRSHTDVLFQLSNSKLTESKESREK